MVMCPLVLSQDSLNTLYPIPHELWHFTVGLVGTDTIAGPLWVLNAVLSCLITLLYLTLCNPMEQIARQALLSRVFSRQEYWSIPLSRDLPDAGLNPVSCISGRLITIWATREVHSNNQIVSRHFQLSPETKIIPFENCWAISLLEWSF